MKWDMVKQTNETNVEGKNGVSLKKILKTRKVSVLPSWGQQAREGAGTRTDDSGEATAVCGDSVCWP